MTCPKCFGLIPEPGKVYGYTGKWCTCIVNQQIPVVPPTQYPDQTQTKAAIDKYEEGYRYGKSSTLSRVEIQIDSLIQEIKQDPSISISQRNYAIKKMEELKGKL